MTISTGFSAGSLLDPATINGSVVYLPSRLTYPTGHQFRFYYTSYGQMYLIEKWVPSITGQGSGRRVGYTKFNLPSYNGASYPTNSLVTSQNPSNPPADCPAFSSRVEQAENWQGGQAVGYAYSKSLAFDWSTYYYDVTTPGEVVVPPDGDPAIPTAYTVYRHYRSRLTLTKETIVNSNATKKEEVECTQEAGLSYPSNLRVLRTTIKDYEIIPGEPPISSLKSMRRTSYTYLQRDGMWLVAAKDEEGYASDIYRRTTYDYTSYPAQRVLGLPIEEAVYAGPGTTLMSKVTYAYDETGSFTDSSGASAPYFIAEFGVVQHDDTNYGSGLVQRGNLTTVRQYWVENGVPTSPRIIKRISYDTSGNVRAVTDGAGNRTQFEVTDNFSNKPPGVGQTHAYVYTTQDPIGFRKGAQYNYYTGQVVKRFNLRSGSSTEEQVVTSTYDFADRILQTNRPDGGWVRIGYWDNWMNVSTYQQIAPGQMRFKLEEYDGAGRVYRKGADHPDAVMGKYSGQKLVYDPMLSARRERNKESNQTSCLVTDFSSSQTLK